MQLNGLHHVTAVTAMAQANLGFYTQLMGMRLVKKTVNQDDVSAYHLFYGDALGSPGTELTFFDWRHLPPNRNGPGSIAGTALRVSGEDSLSWWSDRLTENHVPHSGIERFRGRALIRLRDPEGQTLALVDDGGIASGSPWEGGPVPAEHAVRGLFASTLSVHDMEPTSHFLTEVLGFERVDAPAREAADNSSGAGVEVDALAEEHAGAPSGASSRAQRTVTFELAGGGPGNELYVIEQPDVTPGALGAGGVHHIAFRVPDSEQQAAWRSRLLAAGVPATPVIDRFYFKSVYFRIPGGQLFEIATDGPGFAVDEDAGRLGERLALPPFLEPRRAAIEANLEPLD